MSYVYRHVTVIRVIDGDSVVLSVDMGNKITWSENFRLNGIDTPERGRSGYADASTYLIQLLKDGLSRIETHKPDKYGRWLADLYVSVHGGEMLVNRMMIDAGHAVEYFGGAK